MVYIIEKNLLGLFIEKNNDNVVTITIVVIVTIDQVPKNNLAKLKGKGNHTSMLKVYDLVYNIKFSVHVYPVYIHV